MCDSVNHTRFPKEDHLPDWARRDNKVTKCDRVESLSNMSTSYTMQIRNTNIKCSEQHFFIHIYRVKIQRSEF